MSHVKSITVQQPNKSDVELRIEFDNDWQHSIAFSQLDDRRDVARKLVALSNDILHNENLDAPGLPDDAIVDPDFFRG